MDEDTLAAIQARVDAATPGPWLDEVTSDGSLVVQGPSMYIAYVGDMEETEKEDHANARLIAAARTDVPALLTALAAVTAERDAARYEIREHARALDLQEARIRTLEAARDDLAAALDALIAQEPLALSLDGHTTICVYCVHCAVVGAPEPLPHDADCPWARAREARRG